MPFTIKRTANTALLWQEFTMCFITNYKATHINSTDRVSYKESEKLYNMFNLFHVSSNSYPHGRGHPHTHYVNKSNFKEPGEQCTSLKIKFPYYCLIDFSSLGSTGFL